MAEKVQIFNSLGSDPQNRADLVNGIKSMMLAFCRPCKNTLRVGVTTSGHGVNPKLQVIKAPAVIKEPIRVRNFRR